MTCVFSLWIHYIFHFNFNTFMLSIVVFIIKAICYLALSRQCLCKNDMILGQRFIVSYMYEMEDWSV